MSDHMKAEVITLTDEERRKFVAWLRQEIATDKILIEQAMKLGDPGQSMSRRLSIHAFAKEGVAKHLEDIETQTFGG